MSLAIGVVQKDFIIASSDSALTKFSADREEMTETGIKSEKVYKLSNKVLLSKSGNLVLTQLILTELRCHIKDNYDLKKCREVAMKVLSNINNGVILNEEEYFKSLSEDYSFSRGDLREMRGDLVKYISARLPKTEKATNLVHDFSMYLLGFNEDGTTGLVNVREGDLYMSGPIDKKKGYPAILEGPSSSDYMNYLNLPVEQRRPEGFITAFSHIHAAISKENAVNVSTDCNYHLLMKNGDSIDYEKFTYDTAELHKYLVNQ